MGASGKNHLCVKIDSDVVKALFSQILISHSRVHLTSKNLLDSITEWAHKVLSHQTEVRVEVDVGVCVALGGEVGSKEGPLVPMELLGCWVDGYSPEILLIFCTGVTKMQYWSFVFDFKKALKVANYVKLKTKQKGVNTWFSTCVV